MQTALAERRTMLNLPAMTDLGESSIDPDASKMKAISKELATAFQKVPLNSRLALYVIFLAEIDKFSTWIKENGDEDINSNSAEARKYNCVFR